MKSNLFKLILMTALCIVLCVAAMPFSASAEDASEKDTTTTTKISLFDPPADTSGSAAVSVGSASGKAGDTVTVNVDLTQNPGVIAMQLNVGYDEKQLELVNVSNSGVLNGFNSPSTYGGGNYTLNWEDGLSSTNNNGTGTVATLTFKLKEDCDKASVTVSGKGHNADVNTVNVSGGKGTITNTNPTTTTTTTKPTTTKPTTTKPTTTKSSTTKSRTTRYETTPYTRSYNDENTYPVDFELSTTEPESTTDLLDLWQTSTMYLTEAITEESTTETAKEKEGSSLSKTKLILIVLMACFAIVGIAIIISMVSKSKG